MFDDERPCFSGFVLSCQNVNLIKAGGGVLFSHVAVENRAHFLNGVIGRIEVVQNIVFRLQREV